MHTRHQDSSHESTLIAVLVTLLMVLLLGGGFWFYRWQRVNYMRALQMELMAREAAEAAKRQQQELAQQLEATPADLEMNQLRILAWNVDSGGNDPKIISQQLHELGNYHIVGLSEVHFANFDRYTNALGENYRSIQFATTQNDRLVLAWDSDRLFLNSQSVLETQMSLLDPSKRSHLVGLFRDKKTNLEYQVVLVRLSGENAELRQAQATALREWAKDQKIPTFAIGTFYFDYDFSTQKGNKAFDLFIEGDLWRWVQPSKLVATNWIDQKSDDRDSNSFSCSDFAFVSKGADDWKTESNVIVRSGDFPDDLTTSDHRPIELVVQRPPSN